MKRILGSLLLLLGSLSAGSFTATVDSTEVAKGDSVLLTLAVTGENVDAIPDIPEIDGKKVLHTKRRMLSDYVSVDGRSRMEKTHLMIMEFRPNSDMVIPSFSAMVDGELKVTKPIKVKIVKPIEGERRATKDFALDINIEKSRFYLGEPILLHLYFKQRKNIKVMKIEYTPPTFKDFFAKEVGEKRSYDKGEFTIQAFTYQLIAKRSGKLTIEAAKAKIAQRVRERQEGGWFVDLPKWSQIASSSLQVEVLKPSQKYDLVGKYQLKDSIDHQRVKANKPVTLRIELVGEGTLDDYEGISFEIPKVTVYSDEAKITSKLVGKKLQSRYQKSFVFIADHDFTIPSKTIKVYDYETGEVKELKTKTYHIKVGDEAKGVSGSLVHTQNTVEGRKVTAGSPKPLSLLVLFLTFALGVFVTLFFKLLPLSWFKNLTFNRTKVRNEEALKILYPKIGESAEVEAMVRKLYAANHGDKSVEIDRDYLEQLVEKYGRS